jgi:hypothetical protein
LRLVDGPVNEPEPDFRTEDDDLMPWDYLNDQMEKNDGTE